MGGAKVGGAKVGLAKVGGAKVGGAKVGVLLLCDILSQHVIRSHMHDIYTSLFTNMVAHKKKIQTYKQKADMYTEEVNKVALSAEDDKRVIMEDGIHTKAYGHYRLKN